MMTAERLNTHLQQGGVVQVTTYGRSTLYTKKHAGYFLTGKDGNLYVKRGKAKDCLTMDEGKQLLVSIRLGTYR